MLDSILFYTFATIAVVSALLVITRRNPIHSAVFLITALLATAGIFLQLRAEFLFAAQIILYIGGIMVLFLFVIMLVRLDTLAQHLQFRLQKWIALFVTLALGAEVVILLWAARRLPGDGLLVGNVAPADKLPPNSETFAQVLFKSYLLPFEIASVLLLVAMIGAVLMAKKRDTES